MEHVNSQACHPDIQPILQYFREKYNIPEISPDENTINEIYLDDEIVPLEEFRQEIENRILENLNFLPPETAKLYRSIKGISQTNHFQELELLPNYIFSRHLAG